MTLYKAAKALHDFLAPGVKATSAKPTPAALQYATLHRELGEALQREEPKK